MSISTSEARDRHEHAYTLRIGFDVSSRQLGGAELVPVPVLTSLRIWVGSHNSEYEAIRVRIPNFVH
jgi:hypothetical protein